MVYTVQYPACSLSALSLLVQPIMLVDNWFWENQNFPKLNLILVGDKVANWISNFQPFL